MLLNAPYPEANIERRLRTRCRCTLRARLWRPYGGFLGINLGPGTQTPMGERESKIGDPDMGPKHGVGVDGAV
jgi:hypothetical protein